jgi:hypothetical protein
MSDLNAGTISASTGVKFPLYTNSTRPAAVQGLTIYNSESGKMELYDGSNWIEIGSPSILDGSTEELAAPDAEWIWNYRADKTAGISNGLRWVKLPGETTARRVWCNFENNGGGGPSGDRHGWMMFYQNYGGPRATGTDPIYGYSGGGSAAQQYGIFNGSTYYDETLIPKKDGGQYISGKTHIWDIVKGQGGWDIMKCYNIYDSNGNVLNINQSSTDSGNLGIVNQGTYCNSRPTRQVYDICSTRGVSFNEIYGSSIGGGASTFSNYVGLFLDSGNHGGNFDWGETNTLTYSSGNRGFSNNSDNNSTPRMYGWAARHWISYSSNTTGRDAHRCQFICWGTEDYILEVSLFCRKNYIQ